MLKQKDITKEQVISAYKLFLEREPENENVIKAKLKCKNLKHLINEFIQSEEFLKKNKIIFDKKGSTLIDLAAAKTLLNYKIEILRNHEQEPNLESITSQICTASQFYSPLYKKWCELFREEPKMHRKQWEFVYILQALESTGMLTPKMRGLGFGCGKEPLPCVMASKGINVIASDMDETSAIKEGWTATNEHSARLEDMFWSGVCSEIDFYNQVTYRTVNMNEIPIDLTGFDFVWSSCALEHLGSIEKKSSSYKTLLNVCGQVVLQSTRQNII
jgi:2-polyprenyl-3-methyl-5-hydroxy-6-metoxy-1,4-benzoquinol methylase